MFKPSFAIGMGTMMHRTLAALITRHTASKKPKHMIGRGRRDMYTYHNVLNNGSKPVPGGGARERERHRPRGEALARMEAARENL